MFVVSLAISGSALLAWIDSPDTADHEAAERTILDLQRAEHALSQNILRLRDGLLLQYDSLDATEREIKLQVQSLSDLSATHVGPAHVHAEMAAARGTGYQELVAEYAASVAARSHLLERFKSTNARLRNSVVYYVTNLDPLIQVLGDGPANHDLLLALQVSANDVGQLYLTGVEPEGADARYAALSGAIVAGPPGMRDELANFAAHFSVILSEKVAVDRLVGELLRGDEPLIVSNIADANVVILAELRSGLRARTMALTAISAILVAYIGFFIFRVVVARRNLHRANAELEQRVEERTAGLQEEIAEREKTAAELHESEVRLARVLEIAPDAMLLIDRDFHVRLYNFGAEAIFGYTADEAVGCSIEMLIDDWREVLQTDVVDSLSSAAGGPVEKISEGRVSGRNKAGAVFPAAVSVSKIVHDGETVLFVIARDISDRIQAEQDVLAAKEHAEIANRSKSQFLANMSHELRTPLNAVIGFAEVIEAETFGPVGNSRYVEYVGDIRESGQHLLSLINDILDLSKIEAGHTEIHEEPVRIASIVGSTLLVVKERAGLAGVALRTEIPDDLPLFLGDERKLKQILINLLTNSVKFTEAGGRVVVTAAADPQIGFTLSVADTGIGIAPEDIPRALASFQQVENALNRRQDGTGLGLPLTVALVELHGGELQISSEPGVGTTITAHFPPNRIVAVRADQRQTERAKA